MIKHEVPLPEVRLPELYWANSLPYR